MSGINGTYSLPATAEGSRPVNGASADNSDPRRHAMIAAAVTLGLTIGAAVVAQWLIVPQRGDPYHIDRGILGNLCAWDGHWYSLIATVGYSFDAGQQSSIVFFPAYPLAARLLGVLLHVRIEWALLIVSNLCALGAWLTLSIYVSDSQPSDGRRRRAAPWIVWASAVFPSTFFFRLGYTESLLLLLLLVAMLGMRRGWPLLNIALVVGLATATRAVGVALVVPFAMHAWTRSASFKYPPKCPTASVRIRHFALRGVITVCFAALSSWGIGAFIAYQWWKFDDPLAFAHAQSAWRLRSPPDSLRDVIINLMTLEPIRSTYVQDSMLYWGRASPHDEPLLNLAFMNPIIWLSVLGLLLAGAMKRLLTRDEWLLGFLLMLIPYVVQTGRQGMTSQARFAAVTFPAYIVVGHALAAVPKPFAIFVVASSSVLLFMYVGMFCSGYLFI